PPDVRGGYRANVRGFDLRISPDYVQRLPEQERLPFVSLVLVHEGVHATGILAKQWLYDEMMGEKLAILYFRELAGPGVVNVLTGKRVWIGNSPNFDLYRTASDFLDKDQLVDYVLYHGGGLYSGPAYVTEDWIVDNLDNWGGLKNRWPPTK